MKTCVRFEVFTAVTTKNAVFWSVPPCGSCQLLLTANAIPRSQILFTLIMEATSSFETSVLTRVTQCYVPEDGTLHLHKDVFSHS
jgi:hypothetical protein